MKGYIFNPKELCGSDGTIKRPIVDEKDKRQIVEHFYIKTPDAIEMIEPVQETAPADNGKPSDDLPF